MESLLQTFKSLETNEIDLAMPESLKSGAIVMPCESNIEQWRGESAALKAEKVNDKETDVHSSHSW